jgi:hypothetical protein
LISKQRIFNLRNGIERGTGIMKKPNLRGISRLCVFSRDNYELSHESTNYIGGDFMKKKKNPPTTMDILKMLIMVIEAITKILGWF